MQKSLWRTLNGMWVSNVTPIKVCAPQFKSTHRVSDKKGLTSHSRNAYNSDLILSMVLMNDETSLTGVPSASRQTEMI